MSPRNDWNEIPKKCRQVALKLILIRTGKSIFFLLFPFLKQATANSFLYQLVANISFNCNLLALFWVVSGCRPEGLELEGAKRPESNTVNISMHYLFMISFVLISHKFAFQQPPWISCKDVAFLHSFIPTSDLSGLSKKITPASVYLFAWWASHLRM